FGARSALVFDPASDPPRVEHPVLRVGATSRWRGLAGAGGCGGGGGGGVGGFGDFELDGLAVALADEFEGDGGVGLGVRGQALEVVVVVDGRAAELHDDVVGLKAGDLGRAAGVDAGHDGAARVGQTE